MPHVHNGRQEDRHRTRYKLTNCDWHTLGTRDVPTPRRPTAGFFPAAARARRTGGPRRRDAVFRPRFSSASGFRRCVALAVDRSVVDWTTWTIAPGTLRSLAGAYSPALDLVLLTFYVACAGLARVVAQFLAVPAARAGLRISLTNGYLTVCAAHAAHLSYARRLAPGSAPAKTCASDADATRRPLTRSSHR